VPVGGSGERGLGVGVGSLPREPQRGEFFDDLAVLVPARWDAFGEGVAAAEPSAPGTGLAPEFLLCFGADLFPAPSSRRLASGFRRMGVFEAARRSAAMSMVLWASCSRSRLSWLMSWACRMSSRPIGGSPQLLRREYRQAPDLSWMLWPAP